MEFHLLGRGSWTKRVCALAWARFWKSFGRASDPSGSRGGVRIAVEPLCRYDTHLINTVDQGVELIQQIEHENVGLLLDTFHMNIEEKSLGDAVKRAGDLLFHLQVCENDRGPPGSGHINWDELALSLSHTNYDGWISLESFTPYFEGFSEMMHSFRPLAKTQDEFARSSLNYLKEKFLTRA